MDNTPAGIAVRHSPTLLPWGAEEGLWPWLEEGSLRPEWGRRLVAVGRVLVSRGAACVLVGVEGHVAAAVAAEGLGHELEQV